MFKKISEWVDWDGKSFADDDQRAITGHGWRWSIVFILIFITVFSILNSIC